MRGEESRFANVSALRQCMGALEAALPGLDLVYLVRKDMRVLTTDPACAIRRLILFREALGDPDLCTLVSVAPQLLYGEVRARTVTSSSWASNASSACGNIEQTRPRLHISPAAQYIACECIADAD